MLSLAIADDIASTLVVAIGYSGDVYWRPAALGGLLVVGVVGIGLAGVRSLFTYFLLGGLLWLAIDASGIHPTLAGVILGLLAPARRWIDDERLYSILGQVVAHPDTTGDSGDTADRDTLRMAEIAAKESLAPIERLEILLHPWVAFLVMPLFALGNGGFAFTSEDFDLSLIGAVVIGLSTGKPMGILAFCWLATRMGIAIRPSGLTWGRIAGGGLLAGIGFTMSLLIADLAFDDALLNSAKAGIFLASVLSAVLGLATLLVLPASTRETTRPPRMVDTEL